MGEIAQKWEGELAQKNCAEPQRNIIITKNPPETYGFWVKKKNNERA